MFSMQPSQIKNILLFVFSAFCLTTGYAQKKLSKKIARDYHNLAYIKTTEVLLKVAEKGYESVDLYQKLGNSFYFNNNMEEASKWYEKLMNLEEQTEPEYYFRYAQTLKYIENYPEADKWMEKFYESRPNDSRAKSFKSSKDYLSKISAASNDRIQVKNLEINSPFSDFGTLQYGDRLIIASSRGGGKLYEWNRQPFLDLYWVEKEDSVYTKITPFSKTINTKYHESSAALNVKDSMLYFTRNDYFDKRLGKDGTNMNRLQIFRTKLQRDSTWSDVKPVSFNSLDYSVAHPAVNSRGTMLFFAADMPDTIGGSDIYVAEIKADGTLGYPVNLGVYVNTEGQETYPFVNAKGDLYFASNGFAGLGGLDVYAIRNFEELYYQDKTKKFVVENLGKPVNSAQDDFAYFENLKTEEGFFSSNRKGGKGDDDIYAFKVMNKKRVAGVVSDSDTKTIIPGATVILYSDNAKEINRVVVGDDGKFAFDVKEGEDYLIRISKPSYGTDEIRVKRYETVEKSLQFKLKKNEQDVALGDDLAKVLDIPMIYFDLDEASIRPDAAVELQKVITVLEEYPDITIEVRSHTDSRATNAYNKALSIKRNKATINYLVDMGHIASSRISGMAYGESMLVNNCKDGVKCSEIKHQANRRSEFIVKRVVQAN